jgi:hypothetical protein
MLAAGSTYMRVQYRWLLLSIIVATLLIVVVALSSRRTVRERITFSFVGYTNLPNAKARSAIFLVHFERSDGIHIKRLFLEVEGLKGHKADAIPGDYSEEIVPSSEGGYKELVTVVEPPEHGRWRASWGVYHFGLRVKLMEFALTHRLLPRSWLIPPLGRQITREQSTLITYNSSWLTNSP